ncbi:MAG: DNA repair protein RecN [Akkermansia sp.]
MLALLKIQNLALVDELVWEPCAGFLGITGETGAGKSVIMGGIALVLGERADKGLIRSGESQCCVSAMFHLPHPAAVNAWLEEAGVPPCEEGTLIIRRVITATGNRQFINSTPVTLSLLRRIGSGLVDMHHPEAHRSLTAPERQLDLLDAYAEDAPLLRDYAGAYQAWTEARRAHRELLESEMATERELDFLRHQVEEIESAGFSKEEIAGLEERWQRARNSSRLRDTALPMLQLVEGDEEGLLAQLRRLVRYGRDLERLDASAAAWITPIESMVEELEDLDDKLRDYLDNLCADPAALAALEERISLLDTLKRKYGADWEAISAHLEACREKLAEVDNREDRLAALAEEEERCRAALLRSAAALTAARKKAAPRLERAFLEHAAQLGFRQSLFSVNLQAVESPGPHGAEGVDFLFGPNPGEPLKPLRLIASSGELARVMLALKSALAKQDDTPLLVFDEIDANVGGEIARAVGMKMRELGRDHQVIAITHFPQVAALADHHYLIAKHTENGRTVSRLREVRDDDRIAELMRMLGTNGPAAAAHARALLQG